MSRPTVMKAFGRYLDYVEWIAMVKRNEDLMTEFWLSDMEKSVKNLEERYQDMVSDYVSN